MRKEWIHRYIPIIILLTLISVSLFIIKDYIVAIIGAFITAYLTYPIHKKLEKKLPSWLAASTTIGIIILIVLIPISFVIKEVISQSQKIIELGIISNIINKINNISFLQKYEFDILGVIDNLLNLGVKTIPGITLSIASSIISLFVMMFIVYYLLLTWPKINLKIRKYIPFENKDRMIREISNTTKKIVKGTLFLALLETLFAGLGFWLAGIDFYLILAILVGLFAIIPGGPAIVWVPALIVSIAQENYISSGIILFFGLFISIYLDTILRTKVAGKDSGINPMIMLLGVIGATPIFGIAGIVVGPLLLSYTLEILEEILEEH